MVNILSLPFATGIATQQYLAAEEGARSAHSEGCSHWYIDLSLPTELLQFWPSQRVVDVAALSQELGMVPILHGNFRTPFATEIPELRAAALRYVLRELDLAAALRAPLIVHGGCVVEPRPTSSQRALALERFVSILVEIFSYANDAGVEVWLENLSHYPRHRPFSYVFTRYDDFAVVERLVPDVKFIFDIGHANVNQKFPMDILSNFGRSIRALSMSNNEGSADSHLGLDQGTVPFISVVSVLMEMDWRGVVGFETRGADTGQSVRFLKSMLPS